MRTKLVLVVLLWTQSYGQELRNQEADVAQKKKTVLHCDLDDTAYASRSPDPDVLTRDGNVLEILAGQTLTVTINIVKPGGLVLFRACEFQDEELHREVCQSLPVVQEQLLQPRYETEESGKYDIGVYVPSDLLCKRCILQYRHIQDRGSPEVPSGVEGSYQKCAYVSVSSARSKRQAAEGCRGTGLFAVLPGIDWWCQVNCAAGYCPSTHCSCVDQAWPSDYDYQTVAPAYTSPPVYHDHTSPPVYQDPTFPPVYHDHTSPPVYQDPTFPPVYQDQTFPPVYHDQTFPPVYHDQTFPPVYQDQTFPPVYHDQTPPPVYHDQDEEIRVEITSNV